MNNDDLSLEQRKAIIAHDPSILDVQAKAGRYFQMDDDRWEAAEGEADALVDKAARELGFRG